MRCETSKQWPSFFDHVVVVSVGCWWRVDIVVVGASCAPKTADCGNCSSEVRRAAVGQTNLPRDLPTTGSWRLTESSIFCFHDCAIALEQLSAL